MKLQPLNDRVVIKRAESDEKTAGGILLPDTAKDKPKKGEVVAVGPGKMLKDGTRKGLQVKVGDKVLFTAWAGNEYIDPKSDTEYLVMQEEEILAVLG